MRAYPRILRFPTSQSRTATGQRYCTQFPSHSGFWPYGVPLQENPLHCSTSAIAPICGLLSGDQIHVASVPRQQCVAWLLCQHPQHPRHANATIGHSQKSFSHREMVQPTMLAFGEQAQCLVPQLLGVTT